MTRQTHHWAQEHRNFRRLLDVLEEQVDTLGNAGQPNYDLMLDVVHYMTHYPDLFHHPKEDLALDRIASRDPSATGLVRDLHRQHRAIASSGHALREMLDAVVAGAVLPREHLLKPARAYIRHFRVHLDMEEAEMFPLTERVLNSEDWRDIDARVPYTADPLFGSRVAERYLALHRHIAGEVGCDCVLAQS
jgi:hemerythrin-like domain-containing protein